MQGSRSWTLTIASGNTVAWTQKEIVAGPQETTTRSPFQANRFSDTLVVTHANYQSAFVPVDAVQTTINVSLKKKSWTLKKLPDTGQKGDYTKTFGEDSDYDINPPSYTNNSNGTTTDNVTGLMWQTGEGGDMSYPAACVYCDTVHLGGYDDWRLPQNYELFSLVSLDKNKPPFDPTAFSTSTSEYWWSINTAVGDTGRAWVVNAGGGTGAHPKSESINVGGTKHISVKCARNTANVGTSTIDTFTDNNDGTVTDQKTGLMWQQKDTSGLTWEQALTYCENLVLAGHDDWRLPNAKELRSISDESLANPSIDTKYFPTAKAAFYWTSTTLAGNTARAWYIDFKSGLSTYDDKTKNVEYVRAVRGGK